MAAETEPRNVIAVCRFRGGPGRESEAAEAWAFELTYYFLRGVGERPEVSYDPATGIYTCRGLMTTTHPGDRSPVTEFDADGAPWDLDFNVNNPRRRTWLRERYGRRSPRFDGRDVLGAASDPSGT